AQLGFRLDLRRDVLPGAAVANEDAVSIEHRIAADAEMLARSIGVLQVVAEIAERPPRIQIRAMRGPAAAARVLAGQLPPGPANLGLAAAAVCGRGRGGPGEAVVRILFPQPVGGHFRIIAQPRFAGPQRGCNVGKGGILLLPDAKAPREDAEQQDETARGAGGSDKQQDRLTGPGLQRHGFRTTVSTTSGYWARGRTETVIG